MPSEPKRIVTITADELEQLIRRAVAEGVAAALPKKNPKLLTPKEACDLLGITRHSLYHRKARGQIPASAVVPLGRHLRFRADELRELSPERGASRKVTRR